MRAAFIEQTGPPENIVVGELPEPELRAGQVLVRVAAAAVNPIDTYIRSGIVAAELPMPFVVGCDLSGTIEAVGPGVKNFKVGQRVWGSNQGLLGRQGTFAEFAAVDSHWLYPTPDGVDDTTAAAAALVGITAHLGLVREAQIQAGETLFVHGGSGGVGSMVVQMARLLGATVITTAGSAEKAEYCKSLGADHVIEYKTENTAERVRELAPDGVNVWWETLREPNFEEMVDLAAPRARLIVMAGRQARPELPVGPFYVKECRLMGFLMFKAPPEEQQTAALAINGWLDQQKLQVSIGATFPLEQAADAHRLQEENTLQSSGSLRGKIVVTVSLREL